MQGNKKIYTVTFERYYPESDDDFTTPLCYATSREEAEKEVKRLVKVATEEHRVREEDITTDVLLPCYYCLSYINLSGVQVREMYYVEDLAVVGSEDAKAWINAITR